jgi:hypothetical protein
MSVARHPAGAARQRAKRTTLASGTRRTSGRDSRSPVVAGAGGGTTPKAHATVPRVGDPSRRRWHAAAGGQLHRLPGCAL